MLNYSPPLRELRFVLHEQLQAPRCLAVLGRYAALDADTFDQIAEQAGRFAVEQVLPLNQGADRAGCRWHDGAVTTPPGFREAYRRYCALGWQSVGAETEHGGQALPRLAFSIVGEMMAAASHAFVMYSAVNHCAAACLRASASAQIREEWLPKLASGEVLAAMCMSEPQAGSDLGLLSTRAEDGGDSCFRIHGSKIFASGGAHDLTPNIANLVLARLAGAPHGTRGLSLFLVPRLKPDGSINGVHCDGIEHKMGLHGSATCTLRFEDAQGWLIGMPNEGLRALFPMMNEARLLSGLQAVGISEAAFQTALAYARERRQGCSPAGAQPCLLIEHPDVQRMLLVQKAWTEAGRAFVHWTAALIDVADWHPDPLQRAEAADLVSLLTPIVKGFLTENAQQSISLALQVHGGHGYVSDTGVEQLARDVRVTTIYEGTTGIQARDLLHRKVITDGGRRLGLLEGLVRAWLDGDGRAPALRSFAVPLAALLAQVGASTSLLAARERERPGASLASSVSYLRLLGHLVLAYLWAKAAHAAWDKAQAGDLWYQAKLVTARFYFNEVLPETAHLDHAIANGGTELDAGFIE